MDRWKGRGMFC